jgi:hypothetical protein
MAFIERKISSFILIVFSVKGNLVDPFVVFIYDASPHTIIHFGQVYEQKYTVREISNSCDIFKPLGFFFFFKDRFIIEIVGKVRGGDGGRKSGRGGECVGKRK